jgi:ABC-type uncharacterized transport system auxiliary subunit
MRIQHTTLLVITLAISTILTGCMGQVRYPTYYELHLPAPPDPPPGPEGRASVAVREFKSPAYLRQGPLVYRSSPEQIGFYDYHRWAGDPRQFVTTAIVERLRASGNFAQLTVYDGRSHADYIISGRLEKLEEVDYTGGVKVEVALSAQMTNVHTGTTVWSNSASDIEEVSQRNVPTVVNEMSKAMDRAIERLLSSFPNSAMANER